MSKAFDLGGRVAIVALTATTDDAQRIELFKIGIDDDGMP